MGDSRALEEMRSENEMDLRKVCTTILRNVAIFGADAFLVYIANVCAYFKMMYQVHIYNVNELSNPFIYRVY